MFVAYESRIVFKPSITLKKQSTRTGLGSTSFCILSAAVGSMIKANVSTNSRKRQHATKSNETYIGKIVEVLVEGTSKKSPNEFSGRNPENSKVVFPKENAKKGTYVNVLIERCTSATLIGKIV